jgi:hypothetical protein
MSSPNPPESVPLTLYEKQNELQKILSSRHFSKAPMRRRFLEFASGQAFLGEDSKLNEYLIGVEVYERGKDFDPQQDPIVRVQAHEIRRALKNYYLEEGKDSLIRIELHPGHYAPVFKRVKLDGDASPTPATGNGPAAEIHQQSFRWGYAVVAFLALACVTLLALFLRERFLAHPRLESKAPASALAESEDWFWKPFLASGSEPLVIVPTPPLLRLATDGDTAETLRGGTIVPKSKLPEFHDTIHFRELRSFVFVSTTTDFTGIGEALGLLRLSRIFQSHGLTVRVKPGRLTDFSEIQGSNTIVLGGANPWTNRVFVNQPGFSVSAGVFRNNAPGPGEQSVYSPRFDPVTNRLTQDYALIYMAPNRTRLERLLLLYGVFTQGTQAAAEYVTNGERLAELRRALLAASPDHKTIPPFFQALISVPVENYVPGEASLLAVKTIPE